MIIVHLKNGIEIKYIGDIYLSSDESFINIQAESTVPEEGNLYIWANRIYDKLWLDEVESIKGVNSNRITENGWIINDKGNN